jgi:hypothetical protein
MVRPAQSEEDGRMLSSDESNSSSLQRAILLMEEALGILDRLGLKLPAARLAGALDSTLKARSAIGNQ